MSELAASPELRPQFRLQPGRDDALIDWLATIKPRRRSDVIRAALRAYLVGQQRRAESPRREDPRLAAALDALF